MATRYFMVVGVDTTLDYNSIVHKPVPFRQVRRLEVRPLPAFYENEFLGSELVFTNVESARAFIEKINS